MVPQLQLYFTLYENGARGISGNNEFMLHWYAVNTSFQTLLISFLRCNVKNIVESFEQKNANFDDVVLFLYYKGVIQ